MIDHPPTETDEALLRAFVAHADREAMGRLLERHFEAALALARRYGLPPADCDDAVQTAFIAAIGAAGGFAGRSTPRTWLLGFVVNAARSAARGRRHRRRRQAALRADPAARDAEAAYPPELLGELAAALAALPERYRSPLELRYVRGLRPAEVAAALGADDATTRSRLARGLDRLRKALGPRLALIEGGALAVAPTLRLPEAVRGWIGGGPLPAAPAAIAAPAMVASAGVAVATVLVATVGVAAWARWPASARSQATAPASPTPVTSPAPPTSPAPAVAIDPLAAWGPCSLPEDAPMTVSLATERAAARAGHPVVRLAYDASRGPLGMTYLRVAPAAGTDRVAFWARAERGAVALRLRLSQGDWSAWDSPPLAIGPAWQRVIVARHDCVFLPRAGGAPRWDAIAVFAPMLSGASGAVLIDDVRFLADH